MDSPGSGRDTPVIPACRKKLLSGTDDHNQEEVEKAPPAGGNCAYGATNHFDPRVEATNVVKADIESDGDSDGSTGSVDEDMVLEDKQRKERAITELAKNKVQ
jgi:hypothetical protein